MNRKAKLQRNSNNFFKQFTNIVKGLTKNNQEIVAEIEDSKNQISVLEDTIQDHRNDIEDYKATVANNNKLINGLETLMAGGNPEATDSL